MWWHIFTWRFHIFVYICESLAIMQLFFRLKFEAKGYSYTIRINIGLATFIDVLWWVCRKKIVLQQNWTKFLKRDLNPRISLPKNIFFPQWDIFHKFHTNILIMLETSTNSPKKPRNWLVLTFCCKSVNWIDRLLLSNSGYYLLYWDQSGAENDRKTKE